MRGLAATVESGPLTLAAGRLEKLLKTDPESDGIPALVADLARESARLALAAEALDWADVSPDGEPTAARTDGHAFHADRLAQVYRHLHELLVASDAASLTLADSHKSLLSAHMSGNFNLLQEALENYDFDAARQLVAQAQQVPHSSAVEPPE